MAREGRSHIHESLSYKVHNHPHTRRHIYIYIYIYIHTYIHTSCTMLSHKAGKVIQTLPTFHGLARYKKCKTNTAIPRERGPSKKQEK